MFVRYFEMKVLCFMCFKFVRYFCCVGFAICERNEGKGSLVHPKVYSTCE